MASNPIRIAVDAMGGDFAPHEIVSGAVQGARELGVTVLLVGQPDAIRAELGMHDTAGLREEMVPAGDVVNMKRAPTAGRRRGIAPTNGAENWLNRADPQAMVAAGSTG